jgi:RNA polymerase sigma-70 factor (TIGR02957 family)
VTKSARVADDLRRLAFSIAYRMTGSVAETEDIVQEALLRLHKAQPDVESPEAYVATITTRLAIDHFRSARVRRETYIGEWLPEPLVEPWDVEATENISMAFLLVLETLSPVERAVFLLREVFEYGYDEISTVVEKSAENCRQIFVRAKRHVEERKPRFEASREKRDDLARRFLAACQGGKLDDLVRLLAADAIFYGDGGGKATSVAHAIYGRDRVARLLLGWFATGQAMGVRLQPACINGQPGGLTFDAQDRLISVVEIDIADGVIWAVRSVVNPDKLAHLGPLSDVTRLPVRSLKP